LEGLLVHVLDIRAMRLDHLVVLDNDLTDVLLGDLALHVQVLLVGLSAEVLDPQVLE